MKLNGWQRIGVIASVLWVLGAGVAERRGQIDHAYHYYSSSATVICPMAQKNAEALGSNILHAQELGRDAFERCMKEAYIASQQLRVVNGEAILKIVAFSTLPAVAAWLLAYLGIRLGRWVKLGFPEGPTSAPRGSNARVRDQEANVAPEVPSAAPTVPDLETNAARAARPPPLWVPLTLFAVAVVFIANRLIGQTFAESPLANLATSLPVMMRHPDALTSYVSEAIGMALPIPLTHLAAASLFKTKRNRTSRRRIFIGWSLAGIIGAFLF